MLPLFTLRAIFGGVFVGAAAAFAHLIALGADGDPHARTYVMLLGAIAAASLYLAAKMPANG